MTRAHPHGCILDSDTCLKLGFLFTQRGNDHSRDEGMTLRVPPPYLGEHLVRIGGERPNQ